MSVGVAIEVVGGVWMAFDSAVTSDDGELCYCTDKGFRLGELGIVAAGDASAMQLVRELDVELPEATSQVEAWGRSTLVPALRELFGDSEPCQMLVACRGAVIRIDEQYVSYRPALGYTAIGSGSHGALCAMDIGKSHLRDKRLVLDVVKAVARHTTNVSEPAFSFFVPA